MDSFLRKNLKAEILAILLRSRNCIHEKKMIKIIVDDKLFWNNRKQFFDYLLSKTF